jgi:hypothetical protein
MTTSEKKPSSSSSLMRSAPLPLLLIVAAILFAGPLAMAQQTATTLPLTPQEQQQQNNLQNTITSLTQYLEPGEQEVGGLVFTPRWSNPVWVEPEDIALVFAYCLPGEFAVSEQKILGGSELSVLESYAMALPGDFMVWAMVVENNHEDDRLIAAAGVICAGDENVDRTAVISQETELEINNILKQFITIENRQISNIQQVINIIGNVTGNVTQSANVTQTQSVTPPPPPPANDTEGLTPPQDTTPPVITVPEDMTVEGTIEDGATVSFEVSAEDDVDGAVDVDCQPPSGSIFPIDETTVECTANDAAGNTATESFTITVIEPGEPDDGGTDDGGTQAGNNTTT